MWSAILKWLQWFWPLSIHNLVSSPPLECGVIWWRSSNKQKVRSMGCFFQDWLTKSCEFGLACLFIHSLGSFAVRETSCHVWAAQLQALRVKKLLCAINNQQDLQSHEWAWERLLQSSLEMTVAPAYILISDLWGIVNLRTQLSCSKISEP